MYDYIYQNTNLFMECMVMNTQAHETFKAVKRSIKARALEQVQQTYPDAVAVDVYYTGERNDSYVVARYTSNDGAVVSIDMEVDVGELGFAFSAARQNSVAAGYGVV